MRVYSFVFSSLISALTLSGCGSKTSPEGSSNLLIENGTEPDTDLARHTAFLAMIGRSSTSFNTCTGTLVSKRHILTAAHCVKDLGNDGKVFAIFNRDTRPQTKEKLVARVALKVRVAKNYNPNFVDDMNAIRNATRVEYASLIAAEAAAKAIQDETKREELLKEIDAKKQALFEKLKGRAEKTPHNDIALITLDSDAPADRSIARLPQPGFELAARTRIGFVGYGVANFEAYLENQKILEDASKKAKADFKIEEVVLKDDGAGILRGAEFYSVAVSKNGLLTVQSPPSNEGAVTRISVGDSGGGAFVRSKEQSTTTQQTVVGVASMTIPGASIGGIFTDVRPHVLEIAEWVHEDLTARKASSNE